MRRRAFLAGAGALLLGGLLRSTGSTGTGGPIDIGDAPRELTRSRVPRSSRPTASPASSPRVAAGPEAGRIGQRVAEAPPPPTPVSEPAIDNATPAQPAGVTTGREMNAPHTSRATSTPAPGAVAASEWGTHVTGVRSRLATGDPVVALTFDACGSSGDGYDAALIDHLIAAQVPATLFINQRWIDRHAATFRELAAQPLFEIANHGTQHRPLSIHGRSAYGIAGTRNREEVTEEVSVNQREIERLTGRSPRHFRSGTAHYDEVAVRIVQDMGLEVVGFDVLGDAGATWSAGQVRDALLRCQPGSIALLHMNHPSSGTARGVMDAVPRLRERGLRFVTVGQYGLR